MTSLDGEGPFDGRQSSTIGSEKVRCITIQCRMNLQLFLLLAAALNKEFSVAAWYLNPTGESLAPCRACSVSLFAESGTNGAVTSRRGALFKALVGSSRLTAATAAAATAVTSASRVRAVETTIPKLTTVTDKFAYEFQPPDQFESFNKPLKTHTDEVNFKSSVRAGYQFGLTVDPVRINSLQDFGTPEEVAAKVVLAEVNRDGVFDVTLMEDPVKMSLSDAVYFYQLNYLSSGKRGKKRFIAKFFIQNQFLYTLTAQCKEEDYSVVSAEMLNAVESYKVITV